MGRLNIRKATKDDIPKILELIQGLADYEKEPDAVDTTAEDILRDGFAENPLFYVLMGEIDSVVQGFALYFYNWSTWKGRPSLFLEDLFVVPECRGKGLGVALLKHLAQLAYEKKCRRMEWMCLDWNQPARDFYESIGAKSLDTWLTYRMQEEEIQQLAQSNV